MLPIQHFIDEPHTFTEIHQRSDQYEISSSDQNIPCNYVLHLLKKNLFCPTIKKKLTYLIGDLDFKKILINSGEEISRGSKIDRIFQDNYVGYFKGRHDIYYDDTLMEKLEEECGKRNIIFINTTLRNFSIDEEEDGRYSTHGICFILLPVSNTNKYNLYYINSHGDVILDEESFEYYKTRTRKANVDFDKALEFIMVETLVKYLRYKLKINIQYDTSKNYNYIGANLQEFDNQGMCFAYPMIIYYYFGCHYDNGKTISHGDQTLTSDTFYNMLINGNVDKMIYFCYSDYCKNLSKLLIDNSNVSGEKLYKKVIYRLKKENFRFVKKLSNALVYFITQDYFVNKIKAKYICQTGEEE